jgi:hypothetical protein
VSLDRRRRHPPSPSSVPQGTVGAGTTGPFGACGTDPRDLRRRPRPAALTARKGRGSQPDGSSRRSVDELANGQIPAEPSRRRWRASPQRTIGTPRDARGALEGLRPYHDPPLPSLSYKVVQRATRYGSSAIRHQRARKRLSAGESSGLEALKQRYKPLEDRPPIARLAALPHIPTDPLAGARTHRSHLCPKNLFRQIHLYGKN